MIGISNTDDYIFEVNTPLGFRVFVTRAYWDVIITIKHPIMKGREKVVQDTLENPSQIRQSRRDERVYLFYFMKNGLADGSVQ